MLRFAGDAVVALWPAEPDGELARAVRLAAQSARPAQALIDGSEPVDGVRLRLKVGIGTGTVRLPDVGGEKGRWDFLASGEPLLESRRRGFRKGGETLEQLKGMAAFIHMTDPAKGRAFLNRLSALEKRAE